MTILNFDPILVGQVGTSPQIVLMSTDDTLDIIAQPGYLNSFIRNNGAGIKIPSLFIVGYIDSSTGNHLAQLFNLVFYSGTYQLVDVQGVSPEGPYLQKLNNLDDVTNPATSRSNLGVEIGVDVQGWSAVLEGISEVSESAVGLLAQGNVGEFSAITLTGTANKISIVDGDAAGGANPVFSIPDLLEVATGITSSNNQVLGFVNNGANLDYVALANGAVPTVGVDGPDSNVNLSFSNKGTGIFQFKSTGGAAASIALANSANSNYFILSTHDNTGGNFKFPGSSGSTGQGLIATDGLGTMNWASLLQLSGGTMTGNLFLNANPTSAFQAVTKQYADAIASGRLPHADVAAVQNTPLTATYNNGTAGVGATLTNSGTQAALVVDGYTALVNDRLLVANEGAPAQNGIYVATNVGSGSTNWILTRATDFNAGGPGNIEQGATVEAVNGTLYGGSGWLMNTPAPYTVGTTGLSWINIYGSGNYTAGTGINITDFVISIANTVSAATVAYPASITYNAQGQITSTSGSSAPLLATNNLSDLLSASTARTNLGVAIGTNVQAHSANLDTLAAATPATGFATLDSGGNAYHFRSLTSANSTLSITNGNGVSGNPNIIIPNGTNNSLAGYNGSGLFSGVTVGDNLTLSSGVLSANAVANQWTLIGQFSIIGSSGFQFTSTAYPDILDFGKLYILFYGLSANASDSLICSYTTISGGATGFNDLFSVGIIPASISNTEATGSMVISPNLPPLTSPQVPLINTLFSSSISNYAAGAQSGINNNVLLKNASVFGSEQITGIKFTNSILTSYVSGLVTIYGSN